ncbi:MAG TPA: RsmB/NOP family class I SAM-dependent RNA methyltransferase [Verrucomicrobiales bacterium]|nr:RsmB/NOP family class I SAM-dependent RNA methyltransferase [Verrucomicrobiales bacterium]
METVAKKIHRILAEACVQTLESILRDGMVADRAVARALGTHPKWGARDRAFVAETVYEVVRWRRRLAHVAGAEDIQALAGMQWSLSGYPRPDWASWPEIPEQVREERSKSLETAPLAVRASISDELDAFGRDQLGGGWEEELAALNQPAPVFLRVNPSRCSLKALAAELAEQGLAVTEVAGAPLALRIEDGRTVPARLKESGRFEIQDAGSQQVASFVQAEPGQRIVDACAGAGGKTLHLAALMNGKGDLHALDVQEAKLASLQMRAARAGVKVRTACVSPEVLAKLKGTADRVLVDAPCSGSGTLRRQPDLKYKITAGSVERAQEVQREVLLKYSAMVRPGGKLIYATCSIFPGENERQAAWFTDQNGFTLEEERRISPAASGWDGFYMARWRKTP